MDRAGSAISVGSGLLDEFKAFLFRGNVVDLAVAVIIAGAFQKVVDSMVGDIVMPIIGIFGGAPNFTANTFSINGSKFGWGNFLTQVIAFLIVAAVIFFFIIKPMNLMMQRVRITKETTSGTETVTETTVKSAP